MKIGASLSESEWFGHSMWHESGVNLFIDIRVSIDRIVSLKVRATILEIARFDIGQVTEYIARTLKLKAILDVADLNKTKRNYSDNSPLQS